MTAEHGDNITPPPLPPEGVLQIFFLFFLVTQVGKEERAHKPINVSYEEVECPNVPQLQILKLMYPSVYLEEFHQNYGILWNAGDLVISYLKKETISMQQMASSGINLTEKECRGRCNRKEQSYQRPRRALHPFRRKHSNSASPQQLEPHI